jgi:hypothetical protein
MVTDARAPSPSRPPRQWGIQGQARRPRNPHGQRSATGSHRASAFKPAAPEDRIIFSERDIGNSPKALVIWFLTLYRDLGFKGRIQP